MALGTDFSGGLDLDPGFRQAPSARHALSDAIVRRLISVPGCIFEEPTYGFDVSSIIGSSLTDSVIRQRILAQCLAEEEVQDATVSISRTGETVAISIELEDGDGPFDLTLDVSDLEVSAVFPQG